MLHSVRSVLLVSELVATVAVINAHERPALLNLRQLDVGQGDAALITTPEGRRILIDAGPHPRAVAERLEQLGIDTLDLVIASHAHADHIGGMAAVFSSFTVRAYMDNGIPYTTATYARTIAAVERVPNLVYLQATNRIVTVGSVTIRVLPPPLTEASQNNNSVGIVIEFGRFRALYTGDSEISELTEWLRAGGVPHVTLLKAGHHGARDGVTEEWARATTPAVVVVSVGGRNQYGHPSPGVMRFWKAFANVYRTDEVGEIDVDAQRDGTFTVHTAADFQARRR